MKGPLSHASLSLPSPGCNGFPPFQAWLTLVQFSCCYLDSRWEMKGKYLRHVIMQVLVAITVHPWQLHYFHKGGCLLCGCVSPSPWSTCEGSPRLSCLYTASAVTQHHCVSLTPIERAVEKYCRKLTSVKLKTLLRHGFLVAQNSRG